MMAVAYVQTGYVIMQETAEEEKMKKDAVRFFILTASQAIWKQLLNYVPVSHHLDYRECDETQFKCRYGACIDAARACDGNWNCKDGSDENESMCSELICVPRLWRSSSHHITAVLQSGCIFIADTQPPSCPADQYSCNNGKCIGWQFVCNGVSECGDFSDEALCSKPYLNHFLYLIILLFVTLSLLGIPSFQSKKKK